MNENELNIEIKNENISKELAERIAKEMKEYVIKYGNEINNESQKIV